MFFVCFWLVFYGWWWFLAIFIVFHYFFVGFGLFFLCLLWFSRSGRLEKDYNSGSLNEKVSSCIEASWGLLALRVNWEPLPCPQYIAKWYKTLKIKAMCKNYQHCKAILHPTQRSIPSHSYSLPIKGYSLPKTPILFFHSKLCSCKLGIVQHFVDELVRCSSISFVPNSLTLNTFRFCGWTWLEIDKFEGN